MAIIPCIVVILACVLAYIAATDISMYHKTTFNRRVRLVIACGALIGIGSFAINIVVLVFWK